MTNALTHLVVLNVHVMTMDTRLVLIRNLALVSTCKNIDADIILSFTVFVILRC